VATPFEIPVMTPLLLILATPGLLLDQVPFPEGSTWPKAPWHIVEGPSKLVVGIPLTAIGKVASEMHPVDVSIK